MYEIINYDQVSIDYKISIDKNTVAVKEPRHSSNRKVTNRRERRRATEMKKKHRQELARYADDEIRENSGKIIDTGYRSYSKGKTAWNRAVRHTQFEAYEEDCTVFVNDLIDPSTGEVLACAGQPIHEVIYEDPIWELEFNAHPEHFIWHTEGNKLIIDKYSPDIIERLHYGRLYEDSRVFDKIYKCRKFIERRDKITALEKQREKLLDHLKNIDDQIAWLSDHSDDNSLSRSFRIPWNRSYSRESR